MKDILKFKLMITLTAILIISGCSKHPDTVEIDKSAMPNAEVSSTAYLFNSELALLAAEVKSIEKFNSRNNDVISGEIIPLFSVSNNTTNEYMTALNEAKVIYSNIPAQVQKLQAEKITIAEGEIAEIQSNIDKQNVLQSKIDNLIKAERVALDEIKKEIKTKEQVLNQEKVKIITVINTFIVSNRLPIKKLDVKGEAI